MAENNTRPKIRFKGFSDDWEQRELDSEVEFYSGLTYSPADVIKNRGTFVLRSSNVKNGEIIYADNVFVNSDVVNSANVKKGDVIVVVRNGSRSLIGKHAQIKEEMDNTVIGAFMTGIRAEQSSFINALLDTPQYNKEIEKNLGATINQITTGAFKKMKFIFPEPKEQRTLGGYFNSIDNLIKLHQRKYDKLVNIKKAMLEKMFPKNGSKVPEIRFKGFTDDWKKSNLCHVVSDISDGDWIEAEHIFNEGEYRIIQTGNLGIGEYLEKMNNAKYFYQKDFNEIKANEIFPGDILISRLAEPAGRTIILPNTGYRMVTAVDVTIIRPNKELFDSTFLMTKMNCENILRKIAENVSGTSHKRISRRNLEKTEMMLPELKEQQKIGAFFKDLDGLIALHQRKYDKLINIKKAMLEKMFV